MGATFVDKRFVIVAGKGGVGKSTLCATLGLIAARAGKRTIIAELNTREKAPLLFGKPESGYNAREIYDNLYSINIKPEPALREYALMKLKFERVYRLVFENDAMKRLLRMIPGMTELFLLGKAFNMERERHRDGTPVWDMIIVDAPATGHGVSLFRLPEVISRVASSGPMADEVADMQALLTDPTRTLINLVCLPEEMPVKETIELHEQVERVLGIPTGYLFVNGLWPKLISDEDADLLATWRQALAKAGSPDAATAGALTCLATLHRRRELQDHYVKILADSLDLPTITIPFLFDREFAQDAIERIGGHVEAALGAINQ